MTAPCIFGKIPALTQTAPRTAERNGEDVYKRQAYSLCSYSNNLSVQPFTILSRSVRAVSYTHLDVYKRQAAPAERRHRLRGAALRLAAKGQEQRERTAGGVEALGEAAAGRALEAARHIADVYKRQDLPNVPNVSGTSV